MQILFLAPPISPSIQVFRFPFFFSTVQSYLKVKMKYLYVGIVFFMYNYTIQSQDLIFPTDEETSHVSGGNSTVI